MREMNSASFTGGLCRNWARSGGRSRWVTTNLGTDAIAEGSSPLRWRLWNATQTPTTSSRQQLEHARRLYQTGSSCSAIATHFGVVILVGGRNGVHPTALTREPNVAMS
jgi:hypothetical protein